VLRSNSAGNIEQELLHIRTDAAPGPRTAQNALRETEEAIARVLETSAPMSYHPRVPTFGACAPAAEQHSLSAQHGQGAVSARAHLQAD
jgi:hypothetical protein